MRWAKQKRSHAGALPRWSKRKNRTALKQRATWQVERKRKDSSHSMNSNKKRDVTELGLTILPTPRLDVYLTARAAARMMAVGCCQVPSGNSSIRSAIIHKSATVTKMWSLSAVLQELWRSVNNNSVRQPRLPPKAKEGENTLKSHVRLHIQSEAEIR